MKKIHIMKILKFQFNLKELNILLAALILSSSCRTSTDKSTLIFNDYPDLKIGFTTQNFQKAMPLSVENLDEIIGFAAKEGFQFIELRDDLAALSIDECKRVSDFAKKNQIEVIYEIQKNPLDSGYLRVFVKALDNTAQFYPGILRVMISKSEFVINPEKKGWTREEFLRLTKVVDSCAAVAEARGLRLIIENSDESFFGDGSSYYGLTDFFMNTTKTGFQYDLSNPFRKSSRVKSDPDEVMEFLSNLGSRWVASHIKTIQQTGGEMQPVLTENPLPVEDVINLMGELKVSYVALELLAADEKEQCFNNHKTSITFLRDKKILK